MNAVTHLEKVIVGEVSAVTHLEKVIAGEVSAVTYTEKVITGEAPPITHLQKVIAGEASPVTHLEYVWAGRTPEPTEHEYTGVVPYSFNADGEPLLDWYIKGNVVKNGTPTPQNLVMPEGTGDKTANLCNMSYWTNSSTDTRSRLQFVLKLLDNSTDVGSKTIPTTLGANSVSVTSEGAFNKIRLYHNGQTSNISIKTIDGEWATGTTISVSFNATGIDPTVEGGIVLSDIMVNVGNPTTYEPYGQYKIPISSANTTTPVYLGEVETTRKIRKLVLTGNETVAGSAVTGGWIITNLSDSINNTTGLQTSYCSHYIAKNNGAMSSLSQGEMCISTQVNNRINFVTTFATADDFKTYLQQQYANGTPVTVWYVLATPTTGIVNEPLMKIGEYADEVSNVATIPTNNGSTTIDVETAVKPSEVYIKYKGV